MNKPTIKDQMIEIAREKIAELRRPLTRAELREIYTQVTGRCSSLTLALTCKKHWWGHRGYLLHGGKNHFMKVGYNQYTLF